MMFQILLRDQNDQLQMFMKNLLTLVREVCQIKIKITSAVYVLMELKGLDNSQKL